LRASGGEHLLVLVVQAKDFQLNCGQSQGLVKLIMAGLLNSAAGGPSLRGMDATSEAAFLPPGCLPSVVLGPAVLLLVPGLKPGLAEPPAPAPWPWPGGGRAWRRERLRATGGLLQPPRLPVGWYRPRHQPDYPTGG
jgi:hypothetical protein